jgi:hypothetical protein
MISFEEDDYINEQKEHSARWVVELSDSSNVYYDDFRPGVEDHSSWSRLKAYCDQNNLHITSMYLQFRSHYESVEPNKEAYFFSKMARGVLVQEQQSTYLFFLVGFLEEGKVKIYKYSIPELIVVDIFYREIDECQENLIWAKKE